MYPIPTIFTKHMLIPLSEAGATLGDLLTTDPELQRLAVEHGFRNSNRAYFDKFVAGLRLQRTIGIVLALVLVTVWGATPSRVFAADSPVSETWFPSAAISPHAVARRHQTQGKNSRAQRE